jgi:hypothetical protein
MLPIDTTLLGGRSTQRKNYTVPGPDRYRQVGQGSAIRGQLRSQLLLPDQREGRWPFCATGSGSLLASGGYGLSAEEQLHRYALIRNIQGEVVTPRP